MRETIQHQLNAAWQKLSAISDTARLDVELLLAYVLGVSRSHLHAYPGEMLTHKKVDQYAALIKRRLRGEPIAYILGRCGFWDLDLKVTKDTLIPRPETELLIELALERLPQRQQQVVELGTGCGAIALSLAKARPSWRLFATDQSKRALRIAEENAETLGISGVLFLQGNWCKALPKNKYHAIVSNPPYISENDPHLLQGDVRFEPRLALISGRDGLDAIRHIISQAKDYLVSGGWLLLEHGFDQGKAVRYLFQEAGFHEVSTSRDLANHERVTGGTKK